MKYYFIAGEASGDLHASNLIKELVKVDKQALQQGFGGDLMEKAGMKLTKHYREMAFMGIIPVLMNLKTIKRNFATCEKDILEFQPDVLILIDYPGFNLRMAEFAKKHGIKVYYYISPKIWAWKKNRIKKIKAFVDEMFTILPFETEFYNDLGYEVNYVGNPSLDSILSTLKPVDFDKFISENGLENKPVIALVPGSRMQEIKSLLPRMLEGASVFTDYQLVITAAPSIDKTVYEEIMNGYQATLVFDKTYETMQHAKAALVASGTASLEAGIIKVPQIVCYNMAGGVFLLMIAKWLIEVKWVSLVNIILDREAVRELMQQHFSIKNIRSELNLILNDTDHLGEIEKSYQEFHAKLGKTGASKRAANLIFEKISEKV